MSNWSSTELVFQADPVDLEQTLRQFKVLARMDYLPASVRPSAASRECLVTAVILTDERGRIATVAADRVQAGPDAKDLMRTIATRMGCSLWVPSWDLDIEPVGRPSQPKPAASEQPDETITVAVVTPAPMSAMPMYAAAVAHDLSVLDLEDRRVVMSTSTREPIGFGHFGWSEDTLPALVLVNHGGEHTVALHQSEAAYAEAVHSWDLVTEYAYGQYDKPPAEAQALIDEFFTSTSDAEAFAAYAGVSVDKMKQAMALPGRQGMVTMIAQFGLPGVLSKVLEGTIVPRDVPGVETFSHESWRGAIKETTRLYMAEQFPTGSASEFWTSFGQQAFAHPRMRYALAGGGALLGALLLRSALKTGGKVRGIAGALFIADAISNVVLPPLIAKWMAEDADQYPQP